MSAPWTFDSADNETGGEVECEKCSRTVAPTEPCFSHRDYLHRWAFVCVDCVCVLLGERGAA